MRSSRRRSRSRSIRRTPTNPFLPPDLFDPTGAWVCVTGPRDLPAPIASEHARVFAGRSAFLVFIRLPEGREATLAYLDKLNRFPNPWKVMPREPPETAPPSPELNPQVPQFPVGTQVALVRPLMVVTDEGKPMPTPLTESVQLRTYREILVPEKEIGPHSEKMKYVNYVRMCNTEMASLGRWKQTMGLELRAC